VSDEDGKFKVLPGGFGNDPDVQKAFTEALRSFFKDTKGNMKAFAIVVINGDNVVGSAYDCGDVYHTLLGGISSLENRVLNEETEGNEEESS